jgi:hypothetical protein
MSCCFEDRPRCFEDRSCCFLDHAPTFLVKKSSFLVPMHADVPSCNTLILCAPQYNRQSTLLTVSLYPVRPAVTPEATCRHKPLPALSPS